MKVAGTWIDQNWCTHCGSLFVWGEWEPESDLLEELTEPPEPYNQVHFPHYLWKPKWSPPSPPINRECPRLHNTDPYIFGDAFIYSNCRQDSNKSLRHLEAGTVIAFGSGKNIKGERNWVLDTVLVVEDYWTPTNRRTLSETFNEVTGKTLAPLGKGNNRYYFGATPKNQVNGMFSFFPALPASHGHGFARPAINKLDPQFLNPRNWQGLKGASTPRSAAEIKKLWDLLVKEVFDAGLVLGVHAMEPQKEEPKNE